MGNVKMEPKDIITLIIAFWGAIISTILAFREFFREKRKVNVKCQLSVCAFPNENRWFITIIAVNNGHRPVLINQGGLVMKNGQSFFQLITDLGSIPLPKRLDEHEDVTIYIDCSKIEKVINEAKGKNLFKKAFVQDAEDKKYTAPLPRWFKDKEKEVKNWTFAKMK
jgi:hypothetical protein